MANDYRSSVPKFDPKNMNLTDLAVAATADIINVRKGKSEEEASVMHLSRLLSNLSQEKSIVKFIGGEIVLVYAIAGKEGFKEYFRKNKRSDFTLQVNHVVEDLRNFKSLSEEKQETLEKFCRRLSIESLNYPLQYHPLNYKWAI